MTTAMTVVVLSSAGATVIDGVLSAPVIVPPMMLHLYFKSVFPPLIRTANRIGLSLAASATAGLIQIGRFNISIFGQQLPIGAMLCLRSFTRYPRPASGKTTARGA